MIHLPSSPKIYTLRDQDSIRRLLQQGIDEFVARIQTLENVAPPPPGGDTRLRVGVTGFAEIGTGPGLLSAPNPIYGVIGQYFADPNEIEAELVDAAASDVLLAVSLARGRAIWAPGGVFDWDLYEADVRRFQGMQAIQDAVDDQRICFMAFDEPNHPDFGSPSTITPTDVNNAGLLHKELFPGAMVFTRMGRASFVDGWSNIAGESVPPAPNGWSGMDYAASQYAFQNTGTPKQTPAEWYAEEKAGLATVQVGMIPFINYWDGGNWQDVGTGADLIPACWDHLNNGSSSGIINGQRGDAETPDFVHLTCGDPDIGTPGCRFLVANPDMLIAAVTAAAADPDAPFMSGFVHAFAPNGVVNDPEALDLQNNRSDMIAARQQMIAIGAARTTFNGWVVK